jgi:diphthine synthase
VLKSVRYIFYELYTSPVPRNVFEQWLEQVLGPFKSEKIIQELTRRDIEDDNCAKILKVLDQGEDAALIVPGDPMIATTHSAVRAIVRARGHEVEIVFGISILSAAISITGLSPYRFGPVATVTYPRLGVLSERPYDVTKDNLSRNLHTLLLLDIHDTGRFMTIQEAVEILLELERRRGEGVFKPSRPIICLVRIGYPDYRVVVTRLERARELDLGEPPHSLIVPARLSPVEAEVLMREFGADPDIIRELT